MSQTLEFINTVIEEELNTARMCIFTLPSRRHTFVKNPDEAVKVAENNKGKENVYFAAGIFGEEQDRRTEENCAGLIFVGVDIDLAGEAHSKKAYPKTQEEALSYIDKAFPFRPTTIIHSGNGVQAFYAFKEPWIFDDPGEKVRAKQLCSDIIHTFSYYMACDGYTLDPTFDLARVFRMPGTLNIKDPNNHKEVVILENSGGKYLPEDFEEYIVKEKRPVVSETVKSPKGNEYNLVLNPNAIPDKDKHSQMLEADSEYKLLYCKELDKKIRENNTTPDNPDGDASLSVYDYKLALKGVEWGLSPQGIANLIIAFRRQHMEKPDDLNKALRVEYMNRTIKKAQAAREKAEKNKDLRNVVAEINSIKKADYNEEEVSSKKQRQVFLEAINKISSYIGYDVARFIKYDSEPAEYEIILTNGTRIKIGYSKDLLSQATLRARIFESLGVVPDSLNKSSFDGLLKCFGFVQEVIKSSFETKEEVRFVSWLMDYLNQVGITDDPQEAFSEGMIPFQEKGKTYIFGQKFRNYITTNKGENTSARGFGMVMTKLGCKDIKKNFKTVDNNRTRIHTYDITEVIKKYQDNIEDMVN